MIRFGARSDSLFASLNHVVAANNGLLSKLKSLVPRVCGGGGFGYGAANIPLAPKVSIESIGLVEYDSKEGGSAGGPRFAVLETWDSTDFDRLGIEYGTANPDWINSVRDATAVFLSLGANLTVFLSSP